MEFEELVVEFNESETDIKQNILIDTLNEDPLLAFAIFSNASLEAINELLINTDPSDIEAFFLRCWDQIADNDEIRINYFADVFIALWQQFPNSTYATHVLSWMIITSPDINKSLKEMFLNKLIESGYPIPKITIAKKNQTQDNLLPELPVQP